MRKILLLLFVIVISLSSFSLLLFKAEKKEPEKKPSEFFSKQVVSLDDDPVMGDKKAPLTLIEFSDFECGNCKLFFLQTLPLLKENYINKGKLKLVYRDFPVRSHEPLATKQAIAAACAREQGGDVSYYAFHDKIFLTTTSGGRGMKEEQLPQIVNDLNLDNVKFNGCFESDKYKSEVEKDFNEGMGMGVTGTPTFFLGKSSDDGIIKGTKISGAMPYAAFKILIEELLRSHEATTN